MQETPVVGLLERELQELSFLRNRSWGQFWNRRSLENFVPGNNVGP
jgi:hypothetical protein